MTGVGYEYVLWTHVAVDDAEFAAVEIAQFVSVMQPSAHVNQHRYQRFQGDWTLPLDGVQRLSVQILHDHEQLIALLSHLERLHRVGVVELRC